MKKIVVSLCAMGLLFFGVEVSTKSVEVDLWGNLNIKTYDQLKKVFAERMYSVSGKMLSFEDYKSLAYGFLEEAEKKQLHVVQYCKKHPRKKFARLLLQAVIPYAIADFFYKQRPINDFRDQLDLNRPDDTGLRIAIKDIQGQMKEKFDIEAELSGLVQLIQEANKAYYRLLPSTSSAYASIFHYFQRYFQ